MQKHLLWLIVLVIVGAAPALALEPYIVTGVTADATAASAAKARDQAINDASHKAFEMLSKQIFPNRAVPKVSDQTLGNMISDFRVEQEQVAGKRYVATFTFRFRQNQVRAAFGVNAILPSPRELTARVTGAPIDESTGNDDITEIVTNETGRDPGTGDITQQASIAAPSENNFLVEVTAHDQRELDQAMDRFRDADAVRRVEYVSITPDSSILRLSYVGAAQQVLDQLQMHGVSLRIDHSTQPPLYVMEP